LSDKLELLNISFVQRNAPASGPTSSDAWNDSMEEITNDLSRLSIEWTKLYELLSTIPYGDPDIAIDAFENGLDGRAFWVNSAATDADTDLTFWNAGQHRPVTVYEALQNLYLYIDGQLDSTINTIVDQASGLTTDQKERIGLNVFDNSLSSRSDSLDVYSSRAHYNIIQLAQDLYGSSYSLKNTGVKDLTYYSVKDMVDALLVLHNGSWNSDITLSHAGVTISPGSITASVVQNDSYSGTPSTLTNDLDQIRTTIKTLKGTTTWTAALPALYSGGTNTLKGLLDSVAGTAAGGKTVTNPWGYKYDNIEGLVAVLDAIGDFTGQVSHLDNSPTYLSTTYITNGDSLVTAAGKLDARVTIHADLLSNHATQLGALATFVGQDSIADNAPIYTSANIISQGDPLETAIGKLDGMVTTISGQLAAKNFLSLTDTPASYSDQASRLLRVRDFENGLEFAKVEVTGFGDVTSSGSITAMSGFISFADVEVVGSVNGLILESPDGTRWHVTVDNFGVLNTSAI